MPHQLHPHVQEYLHISNQTYDHCGHLMVKKVDMRDLQYITIDVYTFPYTRTCKDADTVTFISKVVPFTEIKTDDFSKQATLDRISILTNLSSTTTINLEAGDTTRNALLKIVQYLTRVTAILGIPTTIEPSLHPFTTSTKQDTHVPRVPSNNRKWTKGTEHLKKYNLRPRFITSLATNM